MKLWHEIWQKEGVVAFRRDAVVMVSWLQPFQVQDGWKGVVVVFLLGGHCHELHTPVYASRDDAEAHARRWFEEIKKGVLSDE